MAMSKKLRRLIVGFIEAIDNFEAAVARSDIEDARKYGAEIVAYCDRHQDELDLSDEAVEEMKTRQLKVEKRYAEELHARAVLERARRVSEELDREFYEAVLEEEKRGRIKWQ